MTLLYHETHLDEYLSENGKNSPFIVAIGDSWFDYPLNEEILEQLHDKMKYPVLKISHYGYELAQMLSGELKEKKITCFEKYKRNIKGVLLSGGGNDIVGPNMYLVSEDYDKGRSERYERKMQQLRLVLLDFMDMIKVFVSDEIKVCVHCYDYPIPSDKGYSIIGMDLAGPWIKPTLDRAKFNNNEQADICMYMIDSFYSMLVGVAGEVDGRLIVVDTRNTVKSNEWHNEIHPTAGGFRKISNRIHQAVSRGNFYS